MYGVEMFCNLSTYLYEGLLKIMSIDNKPILALCS